MSTPNAALAQLRASSARGGRGRAGARRSTAAGRGKPTGAVRVIKKKKSASKSTTTPTPEPTKTEQEQEQQQQQQQQQQDEPPAEAAGEKKPTSASINYRKVAASKPEQVVVPESRPLGAEQPEEEAKPAVAEEAQPEEEPKEPEGPKLVDSPLDDLTEYMQRVRELSVASKACRQFLAAYRKPDEWNTVPVPITQGDLNTLLEQSAPATSEEGEEPKEEAKEEPKEPKNVFEVMKKHGLKAVALVGTRFFNDDLAHYLNASHRMTLNEQTLKAFGEAVSGVTSLTLDSIPLREEQVEQLASLLPALEELVVIGWIAAEEPRAPIKLQNIMPFKSLQRLVLDRVKFHERFLRLTIKELPQLKAVTIVAYRDQGAYQHLGARPNTFLHQFESAFPEIKFTAVNSTEEYTITGEQKHLLDKLRAAHGPAPVASKYVPPSQRGMVNAPGGMLPRVEDVALESTIAFPSLGDAMKEEEEKKAQKKTKKGSTSTPPATSSSSTGATTPTQPAPAQEKNVYRPPRGAAPATLSDNRSSRSDDTRGGFGGDRWEPSRRQPAESERRGGSGFDDRDRRSGDSDRVGGRGGGWRDDGDGDRFGGRGGGSGYDDRERRSGDSDRVGGRGGGWRDDGDRRSGDSGGFGGRNRFDRDGRGGGRFDDRDRRGGDSGGFGGGWRDGDSQRRPQQQQQQGQRPRGGAWR
ncbi:hypothetical protein PTSG_08739 [Salpingoeca rosetta]|uniref:Uncharacterized protein n=1 Tax=Salpingoeca rosetta (strain ATCC 50818 / BSB-021) TaxID=946362 RepID=F2UKJ8_SALR5|nr:uncharacterized protein PTSG_08739 [Salpingoeca rosetta]EGD77647.1 hypothetical protein PTSG_08739 [Salpingoeca rosetta]|eukprot:XP_004990123.1 hypothetical protein PTSG_08739 [Salpingoeca rosetta]